MSLIPDNKNEDSTIKYFNATMLSIHNTMINAVLSIDLPLERWINSEFIMIPKGKKATKTTSMRLIII